MTSSDFSNSLIALACWRAAKTDLHQVMLSVCMVLKNRADAGWYDSDLYENAIRWLAENPGEFPDIRDPQFLQLLSRLAAITSGLVPDKTGGALWFYPKNSLDIDSLPVGYSITTTIGNMVFIR